MATNDISTGIRRVAASLRVLLALTLLLGLVFPLVMTVFAHLVVPGRADGSFVKDAEGNVVGSSLIGQSFQGTEWFHSRPSAAGDGYDALASGASNLGPESTDLEKLVADRRATVAENNGVDPTDVPPDAVTASGSGLDPDISPAYAHLQAARVAAARGLPVDQVQQLVDEHTDGRLVGFIGEPRVNVLELNLALDQLEG